MRRRAFIAGLGSVAAWPAVARAQPPSGLLIGYLSSRSPEDPPHLLAAFRRGLYQTGFDEGQNLRIEYRWALGQYDRLASLAEELLHFILRDFVIAVARFGPVDRPGETEPGLGALRPGGAHAGRAR